MVDLVGMRVVVRVGMVAGLLGILLFALGGAALASTGQNGPTPPKVGDPVGTDVSPHGGYSSTSNFCMQCHEVHKAPGEYALLWKASVTSTCATCHGYMGSAATGTRDPVGSGTIGTASLRTVYDVTSAASEHDIGASSPPGETGITMTQSGWSYSWKYSGGPPAVNSSTAAGAGTASDTGGGLYCASCHTPHGDYGQAIDTKWVNTSTDGTFATQTKQPWAEGTMIWWNNPTTGSWAQKYLHLDASTGWQVCDAGNTNCLPAQVKDAEGQLVSMYGYKLLSTYPNHTYATPQSYMADKYDHDSMKWCGTCHPSRIDTAAGGTYHNHPTGCAACHGNPADATSADFPHTSTFGELLKDYPDALCVTCHTTGALP